MTAIIVHSLDEARAAAACAPAGTVIRLQSPPGAAGHQGIGWWQALLRILEQDFPGREIEAVLDCGDSPGLALAALRAGIRHLLVQGIDGERMAKLADIAAKTGAKLQIS